MREEQKQAKLLATADGLRAFRRQVCHLNCVLGNGAMKPAFRNLSTIFPVTPSPSAYDMSTPFFFWLSLWTCSVACQALTNPWAWMRRLHDRAYGIREFQSDKLFLENVRRNNC